MALSQYFWSTTVKLALPLLVVMAIAAAPSFSGAAQLEHDDLLELADGAPLGKGGRGRFLSNFDEVIPTSRRHLNSIYPIRQCGTPDPCKPKYGPQFTCCTFLFFPACYDTSSTWDKCGSCTNSCRILEKCCNGVCSNFLTDPNNCGKCGTKCIGVPCIKGICGYNGKF